MKLIVETEVHQKVMHWVNKADFEVSGFGVVEIRNGIAYVKDAILLEQTGSAAETEIDPKDINKAEFALRHSPYEMRWWWHSHVNMAVFWSGTDMATIQQLGKQGWFFHTVFNKKDEYKTAFSCPMTIDSPFSTATVWFRDDIDTLFETPAEDALKEQWDEMYRLKVTEKKYHWPEDKISDNRKRDPRQMGLLQPGTRSHDPYEFQETVEDEIEELMDSGWDDRAILQTMKEDIEACGIDISDVRRRHNFRNGGFHHAE